MIQGFHVKLQQNREVYYLRVNTCSESRLKLPEKTLTVPVDIQQVSKYPQYGKQHDLTPREQGNYFSVFSVHDYHIFAVNPRDTLPAGLEKWSAWWPTKKEEEHKPKIPTSMNMLSLEMCLRNTLPFPSVGIVP